MLVGLIAVIAWIIECLGQILKSNSTLEWKRIESLEQKIQKVLKIKFRTVPIAMEGGGAKRATPTSFPLVGRCKRRV